MPSELNHLAMRAEDPSRSPSSEMRARRLTERGAEDRVASVTTTGAQADTSAPVAPGADHAEQLTFTVIATTDGRPLAKRFWLTGAGALETETVATLVRGQATIERVKTLEDFAARLDRLVPHQAVLHGIPRTSPVTVVTLKEYEQMAQGDRQNVITRTREDVQFASAPGCAMLDFDATGAPAALLDAVASPEKARTLLIEAIPELEHAPMLWRPSSSSFLYDGTREVQGLRGQRVYIPLTHSSDIPVFGTLLYERLWLRGYGFVIVSASGQLLDRTLVDRSVWQPERLDFAAGPVTVPPLERRTQQARIWNNPAPFLDVNQVSGLSTHDQRLIEAKRNAAKTAQRETARARRDEWATARGKEIAKSGRVNEDTAIVLAKEAVDGRILRPGFLLQTEDGELVDVAELLEHPAQWHQKRFRDPLEPSYRADNRIAWANLRPTRGRPYVHSHAHGGVRYHLSASRQTIYVQDGALTRVVDQTAEILATEGEVYQYKDQVARVTDDGRLAPVEPEWLLDFIQRRADVMKWVRNGWTPSDLAPKYARTLLAKTGELGLPNLLAITHGPFIRPDGRVVDEPGYDAATEVLYYPTSPNTSAVRRSLTLAEAEAALRILFDPFAMFPFAGDVDRGSALALLLTAAVRPGIPIAPGGLIESHEAGSGKTLLAQSIANLTGVKAVPQALPQPEEEVRKGLFAAARAGLPSVFFDNVGRDHIVDSPTLSMVLTSGTIADRVLGESQHATVPFRSLILLTGNNPRIAGDLNRRLLRVRITPAVENPWLRTFAFDPRDLTEAGWLRMRVAALELILAALSDPPTLDQASGYSDWDVLVRRTVVWIAKHLDIDVGFADPVQSLLVGYREDPERDRLRRLLTAMRAVFGSEPVTVHEVMTKVDDPMSSIDPEPDVNREALSQLAEVFQEIDRHRNSRAIGMYLGQQKGRIVDGMALVSPGKRNGSAAWVVQPSDNGNPPQ